MIKIAVYDKGGAALDSLLDVAEECGLETKDCSVHDLESLHEYPIVVAHIADKKLTTEESENECVADSVDNACSVDVKPAVVVLQLMPESDPDEVQVNHIGWQELLERSSPGTIRLRVSSVGRTLDPPPYKTENGVYVLSLVEPTPFPGMTADKWQEVLTVLTNTQICEQLVSGEAPETLMCYFTGPRLPILETLHPLACLCDMYLSQLAEAQNEPKQHCPPRTIVDVEYWAGRCDWPPGAALAEGQEHLPNHPQWWRLWDDESILTEDLQREWQALESRAKPNPDYGWEDVMALREAIGEDKTAPIETGTVAKAYAAMMARFGT